VVEFADTFTLAVCKNDRGDFLPMTTVTNPAEFSLHRKYLSDRTDPVRWIWSHVRRHWWIIFMMIVGAVGNAALAAVVPVLTGDAFNAMLNLFPIQVCCCRWH